MTPHQILAVATRLFAICIVVYLLRTVPALYFEGVAQSNPYAASVAIVVLVIGLLLTLLLWFFPRTVALNLLPTASEAPSEPASPDLWFAVGAGLLGLWVLTSAVPAALRNLFVLFLLLGNPIQAADLWQGTIYYCLEILIGVWLLLGAKGVRKLIWWARDAGIR